MPSSPSELKLPSLTSSMLLQPFLPVVMFPPYFHTLYKFVFRLEQLCHQSGVDYTTMDLQRLAFMGLQLKKTTHPMDFDKIFAYISEHLESLLETVAEEGFPLLLMHLFPFFQYPDTSFDAVYALLPPLARHMSRRSVEKVFTAVLTRLFDTATEPHQRGQLFSRTTADLVLRRFGLSTFLTRFLGFLIEAVIEPLRASSKTHTSKRINSNIVRMKSQSVLTLMASDLLQSQVYGGRAETDGPDVGATLSYSLAMSQRSYGSDKDYSSSDSEEEVAESSLLAKSSMLSMEGEMEGATLSPLVLTSQLPPTITTTTTVTVDASDPQTPGGQGEPPAEPVVGREEGLPGYSLLGSVPLADQQQGSQTLLTSYQDSLTLSSSSQFDPTQSVDSHFSEDSFASDIHFTSSLHTTPGHITSRDHIQSQFAKQHSLPMGLKLGLPLLSGRFGDGYEAEGEGEEEREGEEGDTDTLEDECLCSYDPQALAISLHISEVASDCLCWLLRRLGPLLALQHIIRPLMENLQRCFLGVLHLKGREVPALQCLASYVECYGDTVVNKMYIPQAQSLVSLCTVVPHLCGPQLYGSPDYMNPILYGPYFTLMIFIAFLMHIKWNCIEKHIVSVIRTFHIYGPVPAPWSP